MESTSDPGQVIAFYSFKGGTGRSMALANVGCTLAQMPEPGKPVLLIDWDLEAPGLHRYFRKHLFQAFRGSEQVQEESPGLIDLFIELRDELTQVNATEPQDIESATAMLADFPIDHYIVATDVPRLHLLKAGRFDKGYGERISRFNWLSLYENSPYLMKAFAARLAKDYSYVLIDSRTGLTDTSNICTMLLPEILVTVFTPNRQSLAGVIDLIMDAGRYRLQSEDVRPLVIYPLPSRIEASEPALRQQWRHGDAKAGIDGFQQSFEKAFAEIYALTTCRLGDYFDDVQIQHAPRYSYGEELAVLVEESRDRFSLTRSFQRLAARLVDGQPPWTAALDSPSIVGDQSLAIDDDLAKSSSEEASRRREADAYLRRLDETTGSFKKSLARYALAEKSSVYVATAGVAALVVLVSWLGETRFPSVTGFLPTLVIALVAGVMASIASRFLAGRRERLESSVTALTKEVQSFRDNRPPYETSDALTLLKERTDPIISPSGSMYPWRRTGAKRDGKIFISYVRSDAAVAGRLYDSLVEHFGAGKLILDVDSISPGEEFGEIIRKWVDASSVMLVVIGPNWSKAAKDEGLPTFLEISMALKRNLVIVPVLVDAVLPKPSELPESIRPLLNRNAVEIRQGQGRWRGDMAVLTGALERVLAG